MLRWRLLLGTLIIAALVGLCWLDAKAAAPGLWLLCIALPATILATQEVLKLLAALGLRPLPELILPLNLVWVLYVWMTEYNMAALVPAFSVAQWNLLWELKYVLVVMLIFLVEMARYRGPGTSVKNIAGGLLAWSYVAVMLGYAVMLRMSFGLGVLAVWIIAVKLGDTGAYFCGSLWGRHKLAPLLSPGKTIEGALGGLLFSCFGAWAAGRVLLMDSNLLPRLVWWHWLLFGLLVGAGGILGDLAESLLKRDAGRKDSSDWMPGFGGTLDILDSLLFSAPIALLYWKVLVG